MLYSILIYGADADIANLSKAEEERLIGQHIVVQGKLAADRGMTLCGFARAGSVNVYTGAERVA